MEIAPLLAMRGFPLSRSGGEMHWRIPGEESVSIRGNMWYSHYRGEGGDAISFARRFFHMNFKEAVRFLLEQSAVPAAGPVQCERQEQKQLRLPPKDSSEEQVRRYLTDIRKVSADVAGYFIETGQVYQSRAEGVPFPVSWTVKMKKKQKETQDILSYHSQAAGCSDKTRAKASGGRQPIEECGRTGL